MIAASSRIDTNFLALRLPDGRRAGVCTEERPRCVHGHYVVSDSTVTSRGIVTCGFRAGRGTPKCNTVLHLAKCIFDGSASVHGSGERFWFVCELSTESLRHLRNIPMPALETLLCLGAGLPGTYDDMIKNVHREMRRG